MSRISREEVANLAKLARLDLAESELDEPMVDNGNGEQVPADVADTSRTVGGMAKRALAKRS